jgi:aryl-alcohol dehydrogenase-like predicted oxidoreductase
MKYNTLGRSGAVVSNFALGTMTFGSVTSPPVAREMVTSYMAHGGIVIETADIYNNGHAETIIGEILRDLPARERSSLVIASKGRFPVGVDPRDAGLSRRHLSRALDASLDRLGVDHIDLYQLHAWDPVTPLEESLDFLADAVHMGKISYGGLSNFTGWQIAKAAAYARGRFPLISMQPQYNLLVREIEYEIIPASIDAGLGLLPWSPLGGGWLSGKYRRDERPGETTRLGENPNAAGMEAFERRNPLDQTWEVINAVESVSQAHEVSMAQVALAWVASRPAVSSVILGARTLGQLDDNLGALNLTLTSDDLDTLNAASNPGPADYPYGGAGLEQRDRSIE